MRAFLGMCLFRNAIHTGTGQGALAALLFTLSGCQHSDYAERRVKQRLEGMERTAKAWGESEASRPGKLQRDFEFVEKEFDERQKKFGADIRGAGELLAQDAKRFEARQNDYRREIWRIMWGKPENIEKTTIDMFY